MSQRTVSYLNAHRSTRTVKRPYIRLIGAACGALSIGQKYTVQHQADGSILITPINHGEQQGTTDVPAGA